MELFKVSKGKFFTFQNKALFTFTHRLVEKDEPSETWRDRCNRNKFLSGSLSDVTLIMRNYGVDVGLVSVDVPGLVAHRGWQEEARGQGGRCPGGHGFQTRFK